MRTVRNQCLDHVRILGRGHLERVLREYVTHYSRQRPHRGIDLGGPVPDSGMTTIPSSLNVHRRDVPGRLVHEYNPVGA